MGEEKSRALFGLSLRELTSLVEESGQPSYRGQQLFEGLYRQRFTSADQISTLPQEFRQSLTQRGL